MPPFDSIPRRAEDPTIYRKQISQMVHDRWEFSRNDSTSYRRKVNRYYDLYRGFIRSRAAQSHRNQVHLPLLFTSIETAVAMKHGLLFGQTPHIEYIPSSVEDAASARRMTGLCQQQFEDINIKRIGDTLLRMGDISGTAVFQWSWKTIAGMRPVRVPTGQGPDGRALFEIINANQVDFDGPWVDVVDVLDWGPAPGFPDIRDMPWCIRRYWMDMDDIIELSMPQDGSEPIFDPQAILDLQHSQMSDSSRQGYDDRRSAPGALHLSIANDERMDRYSKPVEILEMHGVIPAELVPEDGMRNRLITVANNTVTLRNVANPIWGNRLPFGVYSPTPDPYTIYGIGKVEPNDKLQATASRLASQKLDAVDLLIDPIFAYNRLANVDTNKLYSKPGALIGGDGSPGEWLQAIYPDMRGLQVAMTEIESLWRFIQLGTAVSEDAVGGASGGSDRQTAREFLGKMENVQRRMVSEALRAADTILVPLAEAFRALDAQFMTFPKMLRMMGQNALIDPQTGHPIPQDNMVSLEDVVLKYDMRAASAASLIGRSAKQQNDVVLLQAVGASPLAMIMNWQAFGRKLFRDFEEANPEEYILPVTPEEMQMRMMAMQLAMAPQDPNTTKSSKGSKAPSPRVQNSDILDQIIQPTGQFTQVGRGA